MTIASDIAVSRERVARQKLQRYQETIAVNEAIRRLRDAGCTDDDIMQRLSVSRTRVGKVPSKFAAIRESARPLLPRETAEKIARAHGFGMDEIRCLKCGDSLRRARIEIIEALDKEGLTHAAIGRIIGRDRTSVMRAVRDGL